MQVTAENVKKFLQKPASENSTLNEIPDENIDHEINSKSDLKNLFLKETLATLLPAINSLKAPSFSGVTNFSKNRPGQGYPADREGQKIDNENQFAP